MEILVLEASTTSAKAMLYHTQTDTFELETIPYSTLHHGDPAQLDMDIVFRLMVEAGRRVASGKHVDMISLGSTWHSVGLLDKDLKPVTPTYPWNYTGAASVCKELRKDASYVDAYYHRTGCMVNAIYPLFKLELLRQQGYNLDDYFIISLGAYNTYRLTGHLVSNRCLTSGSGLLNIHTRDYDEQSLSDFKIKKDHLCELVEYNQTYPLSVDGATLLELTPGIPVIPTSSDGGLNQVGVGALQKGVATFSVGTSGALRLTADAPKLPDIPSTWCYLSPKAWLSGAATNGCCNCVDWAKARLFPATASYSEIENGITDRNTNPVFLPFLFGERCPGWNDANKGGFIGIEQHHTASDLYLSVQEGVLFNLYQCYKILSDVNGAPQEIKFSGGILNSPAWTQMCADIFNRTLTMDNVIHGSMMGGAVIAMELLGLIPDAKDYKPTVVGTIEPNPAMVEKYQEKYQRYLAAYNASK